MQRSPHALSAVPASSATVAFLFACHIFGVASGWNIQDDLINVVAGVAGTAVKELQAAQVGSMRSVGGDVVAGVETLADRVAALPEVDQVAALPEVKALPLKRLPTAASASDLVAQGGRLVRDKLDKHHSGMVETAVIDLAETAANDLVVGGAPAVAAATKEVVSDVADGAYPTVPRTAPEPLSKVLAAAPSTMLTVADQLYVKQEADSLGDAVAAYYKGNDKLVGDAADDLLDFQGDWYTRNLVQTAARAAAGRAPVDAVSASGGRLLDRYPATRRAAKDPDLKVAAEAAYEEAPSAVQTLAGLEVAPVTRTVADVQGLGPSTRGDDALHKLVDMPATERHYATATRSTAAVRGAAAGQKVINDPGADSLAFAAVKAATAPDAKVITDATATMGQDLWGRAAQTVATTGPAVATTGPAVSLEATTVPAGTATSTATTTTVPADTATSTGTTTNTTTNVPRPQGLTANGARSGREIAWSVLAGAILSAARF